MRSQFETRASRYSFDNAAYVNGGPDVIAHLRQQIPSEWKASLRAVDGSVVDNVQEQTIALPDDVIIKQAFLAGVPLIDLRLVCNEDTDYANEIEPSAAGGRKIAGAIVRVVGEHSLEKRRTHAFI